MDQPAKADFKKRERIAARVSAAFKARGYQLVQYGGATVEQYSRGKYTTSDVDLGFVDVAPSLDVRAQIMESLGCERGTRLYLLEGVVVDLGGQAELLSPRLVELDTPEGLLLLEAPEESLVQRVLMSVYPQDDEDQKKAALMLMVQALAGNLPLDWNEVDRLAALPGFKIQPVIAAYKEEAKKMVSWSD
ncbi:MAG TPA: hypothetical protein VGZ93_00430 [Candidatus Methylacidiphilales bacterium]|jgi:hypothetical protein|nr:hypothetical protein [Candidatus Methylacidiphilales bacterium]